MKKQWFSVTQVQKNIFAIAEFLHWEKVVSYLIMDKKQAFLIDTGMGYTSILQCVKKITTLPVTVLLTHAHWDHIGSVYEFKKVMLFNHPFERMLLKTGFSSTNIPELHQDVMFSGGFVPKFYTSPGATPTHTFQHNDIVYSDSFEIHVLHTPGHTPGSCCFFIPKFQTFFAGDTLYPGPLYAQLKESSIKQYSKSMRYLKKTLPKTTTIFPGHNSVKESSLLIHDADRLLKKITTPHTKVRGEISGKYLSIIVS